MVRARYSCLQRDIYIQPPLSICRNIMALLEHLPASGRSTRRRKRNLSGDASDCDTRAPPSRDPTPYRGRQLKHKRHHPRKKTRLQSGRNVKRHEKMLTCPNDDMKQPPRPPLRRAYNPLLKVIAALLDTLHGMAVYRRRL